MPTAAPFSISRVLDAQRALVYKVYTEPKHLEQWLSPPGFKTIHAVMDLRVGGTYHYGLEGPNGMQMWGKQVFREIVPNEKLVYIQSFSRQRRWPDAPPRIGELAAGNAGHDHV